MLHTSPAAVLRGRIQRHKHEDEAATVARLLTEPSLTYAQRHRAAALAQQLISDSRKRSSASGVADRFLQEYGLSTREGVAMMGLAESLLRVPDACTRDELISEKIRAGGWRTSPHKSRSFVVNRARDVLALTDRLLNAQEGSTPPLREGSQRFFSRIARSPVRAVATRVMRLMGRQYVLGATIDDALRRARKGERNGLLYSFDMLGEAARTTESAVSYLRTYEAAIEAVGAGATSNMPERANGISVKLSALHPRYGYAHHERNMRELLPRVRELCRRARAHGIGLTIDAEEADRLELSMDIFEALARAPELADWDGLGFVVQAYGKRSSMVIDWLVELACETDRRIPVRLVKGAYWDTEIKRSQEAGHSDYPVFTRKANTDLCYEVCARKMLDAGEHVHAQFATHNAYTIAVLHELAEGRCYELQRLHGMGALVYEALATNCANENIRVRVYAPVGPHDELLPYLVRRLLENGANSSFVNRLLDESISPATLTSDVRGDVMANESRRHARIPLPRNIMREQGDPRPFTSGIDLTDPDAVEVLGECTSTVLATRWEAGPIVGGLARTGGGASIASPADRSRLVGTCRSADEEDVETALCLADAGSADWNGRGGEARAEILERAACLLEARMEELTGLLAFEAGRTLADGVAEVREAADFLRYYASRARHPRGKSGLSAGDAGDEHSTGLRGRGVFFCISPWNFPLAIFTGQVSAALAAGNCVIAKPAEQTPIIGSVVVRLLHEVGVPPEVLHFLPGDGPSLGRLVVPDARVRGVAFTGSTAVARILWSQLARRPGDPPVLIAETGGQNCMVVDSSALPEQVVDDVVRSAFSSAGQRCSALRVLYLQEDIADEVMSMLEGAMAELSVGESWRLSTDVGPVIDEHARSRLLDHIGSMKREGRFRYACDVPPSLAGGTFVAPHLLELSSIRQLRDEIFGPVLHVIRYDRRRIGHVIEEINSTGYGLTMGVHSRIEGFARRIVAGTRAGNNYINRDMIGALVGVHPFGGNGLSGTGPKAGGPHYLPMFCESAAPDPAALAHDNAGATPPASSPALDSAVVHVSGIVDAAVAAQQEWEAMAGSRRGALLEAAAAHIDAPAAVVDCLRSHARIARTLFDAAEPMPGPAGEENRLGRHALGVVVVGIDESDAFEVFFSHVWEALAAGNAVIAGVGSGAREAAEEMRKRVIAAGVSAGAVQVVDWPAAQRCLVDDRRVGGLAWAGEAEDVRQLRGELARQSRAITHMVGNRRPPTGQLRFAIEKMVTVNTMATGGDPELLSLQE